MDALQLDFSKSPGAELRQGPTREEEVARARQQEGTRAAIGGILAAPIQAALPTSLPELGGLLGGLAPALFAESRIMAPVMGVAAKAPAFARPYIPSLVGSTAGSVAGTVAEQGVLGKNIASSETAQKALENSIENAFYDIGGNLVFQLAGKAVKIGKDKLSSGPGAFDTPEGLKRKAAQEWLSNRGATLTKGELTGDVATQGIEGALKVSPVTANVFAKNEAAKKAALESGVNDVMASLETSDAFKQALKVDVPANVSTTQSAAGSRFQGAVDTALTAMKDKYRPVYQRMDVEGDGLRVNIAPYKSSAQAELDKIQKRYPKGNYPDAVKQQSDVLNQIVSLDDVIPMSAAHEIRSDFLASARGMQQEGKATTAAETWYNKAAAGLRNRMDETAVVTFGNEEEKALARSLGLKGGIDQPSGLRSGQYLSNADSIEAMNLGTTVANKTNNPLLRDYFNAQQGYKDAMEGLQDATIRSALKAEPRSVGTFLFNPDTPDRINKVRAAIRQAQKYLPPEQSKGLMGELQYGYLDEMFGKPEGLRTFATKMQDKTFKEGFNVVFQGNKQLQEVANAAQFALEKEAGGGGLKTQAISGGMQLGGLGLAYFVLPESVKDKLDPAQLAVSGATLILTPRLMASALTNKKAMDGLALLSKAQTNPKYGGALAAKGIQMMQNSGVINSEYLREVNTLIHGQQGGPQQQQPAPSNSLDMDFTQ